MDLSVNPRPASHAGFSVLRNRAQSVASFGFPLCKVGQAQLHKVGMRLQWEGTPAGQGRGQGSRGAWWRWPMFLSLFLSLGPGRSGPFTSFLSAALQGPGCPQALLIVSAWPGICLGFSRPSLGLAGLPSNLFTHILFKADSGPSEQLASLAAEVPSHVLIQAVWLGHSQASGSSMWLPAGKLLRLANHATSSGPGLC